MAGFFRSTTIKIRNKMLHHVIEIIKRLEGKVDTIERNQLTINHHTTAALFNLKKELNNSGAFHISDTEVVAKIFSGVKMYLDPRDIAVAPHLILDSVWEHRITSAWLSVVNAYDTVLDIGANFGYYGVLAAQKTDKKRSKIIFFEANPDLIPYIKKTLSVNWFNEQSIVENLAISDAPGELTLNILDGYLGSSSVQSIEKIDSYMHGKMELAAAKKVSVKADTVDDYCESQSIKQVDLIKMDIEGLEDKAYAGMRKTIKSSPNVTMFVEFTKEAYEKPKEFYETMLKDFGNVYSINDEGLLYKPKNDDYRSVIGDSDDWVMPVFSKNANLAQADK